MLEFNWENCNMVEIQIPMKVVKQNGEIIKVSGNFMKTKQNLIYSVCIDVISKSKRAIKEKHCWFYLPVSKIVINKKLQSF